MSPDQDAKLHAIRFPLRLIGGLGVKRGFYVGFLTVSRPTQRIGELKMGGGIGRLEPRCGLERGDGVLEAYGGHIGAPQTDEGVGKRGVELGGAREMGELGAL